MHVQRRKMVVYKEFTIAGYCITMTPFAMTRDSMLWHDLQQNGTEWL